MHLVIQHATTIEETLKKIATRDVIKVNAHLVGLFTYPLTYLITYLLARSGIDVSADLLRKVTQLRAN
jgi:hypothetical protein